MEVETKSVPLGSILRRGQPPVHCVPQARNVPLEIQQTRSPVHPAITLLGGKPSAHLALQGFLVLLKSLHHPNRMDVPTGNILRVVKLIANPVLLDTVVLMPSPPRPSNVMQESMQTAECAEVVTKDSNVRIQAPKQPVQRGTTALVDKSHAPNALLVISAVQTMSCLNLVKRALIRMVKVLLRARCAVIASFALSVPLPRGTALPGERAKNRIGLHALQAVTVTLGALNV